MMITNSGMLIRISLETISTYSRNTQGVKLINLKDNQKVATVALVAKQEENDMVNQETSNIVLAEDQNTDEQNNE